MDNCVGIASIFLLNPGRSSLPMLSLPSQAQAGALSVWPQVRGPRNGATRSGDPRRGTSCGENVGIASIFLPNPGRTSPSSGPSEDRLVRWLSRIRTITHGIFLSLKV